MAPRLLRALLLTYPPSLRHRYGLEMADAVEQAWRHRPSFVSRLRLAGELLTDSAASWRGKRRPSLRNSSSDLRDALRLFKRAPLFALGAVFTLALGIGASTAIFSLADAVILRPLPIPDPDRVLQASFSWSYQDFRDLADETKQFSSVAAWAYPPIGVERNGRTIQLNGAGVSGDYFDVAGQQPLIGRLLTRQDDQTGVPVAAVISERLWRREFSADRSVLGSVLMINRRPATIVGVVPAAFRGLSLQITPEIFVPLASTPNIATGFLGSPGLLTNRGRVWLNWAGRLASAASAAGAEAETKQIYAAHRPETRSTNAADTTPWLMPIVARATGASIRPGSSTSADLRRFMWLLIASTVVTLVLACATVANLLLVRAERRRSEFSVRAALGAGRGRLIRLLVIESLGIGLAGGLAGAGVAAFSLKLIETFTLPGQISIEDLRVVINARILLASASLGLLTAIVFGLSPMWQLRRLDVVDSLRGGGRQTSRQPLRHLLVGIQVALCVVLLSGSLAFGRAVQYALNADLGFNTANTTIVTINPAIARITAARIVPFQQQTLDALRGQPHVRAAGWSAIRPMAGAMIAPPLIEGYMPAKDEDMSVQSNIVSDGYFDAMEIPIQAGRIFSAQDTAGAPPVTIVNATMARKYWAGRNAVGGRISFENPGSADPKWITVVGVVADARRAIGDPAPTFMYLPAAQSTGPFGEMDYLIVRADGNPERLAADLRATLQRIDPTIPVTKVTTMRSHVDATLMTHRLGLTLFALFAGLSVLLTGVGLYAVVASAVASRTREIGIRVALGAGQQSVMRLVIKQGLVPVIVGLVLGLAVAAGSAKLIVGFMFSLPALTPGTVAALIAGVGVLAFLAMLFPARRALAVDPAITLRAE